MPKTGIMRQQRKPGKGEPYKRSGQSGEGKNRQSHTHRPDQARDGSAHKPFNKYPGKKREGNSASYGEEKYPTRDRQEDNGRNSSRRFTTGRFSKGPGGYGQRERDNGYSSGKPNRQGQDGNDNKKRFRTDDSKEFRRTGHEHRPEHDGENIGRKSFGNNPGPVSEGGTGHYGEKKYSPRSNRERRTDETPKRFSPGRSSDTRSGYKKEDRSSEYRSDKPYRSEKTGYDKGSHDRQDGRKPYKKATTRSADERPSYASGKPFRTNEQGAERRKSVNSEAEGKLVRLNKYIANAGICSRREADDLIQAGAIRVNGKVVSELGIKIDPSKDKVVYGDQAISGEKPVYLLLNKPKGYITTSDDPLNRKTVMSLVENACKERIYPVGRLDRNTSGLLLFTNDGEIAKKLTHPRHMVTKIYHLELDKILTKNDMLAIAEGLELEDGKAEVDEIAYAGDTGSKREIGLKIHSGKNRIVRRIFESLGYNVVKLDRVIFAGLTKKELPRGHWRFLTEEEINYLKMLK